MDGFNLSLKKTGSGTTSQIQNTCNCTIHADSSHLLIQNAINLKLHLTDSSVSLKNGNNFTATGQRNRIDGKNLTDGYVQGQRNAVTADNTTNLQLCGFKIACELSKETNPTLFGNENVVCASGNTNLVVSGGHHRVMAVNNTNLKVRGNQSKVIAFNTANLSVHGALNEVSVQNTEMTHQLQRIPTGSGSGSGPQQGNEVDISASTTFSIDNNCNNGGLAVIGQNNLVHGVKMEMQAQATPKLNIWYRDRAAINKDRYLIGIFHFKLERLWDSGRNAYSSLIYVELNTGELDEGSYSSTMSPSGAYVLIRGKKDGVEQTLKVNGRRVSRADGDIDVDGSLQSKFMVDFNPDV